MSKKSPPGSLSLSLSLPSFLLFSSLLFSFGPPPCRFVSRPSRLFYVHLRQPRLCLSSSLATLLLSVSPSTFCSLFLSLSSRTESSSAVVSGVGSLFVYRASFGQFPLASCTRVSFRKDSTRQVAVS